MVLSEDVGFGDVSEGFVDGSDMNCYDECLFGNKSAGEGIVWGVTDGG